MRERFAKHDDVHRSLRPGGKWSNGSGPETSEEWAQTEAYMGLFEHCEIMVKQRLFDVKTFADIYNYRFYNIIANDVIRIEQLIKRSVGWKRFLELLKRTNIEVKP